MLVIVATPDGTSTTIGRKSDNGRLYFNKNGERANFLSKSFSKLLVQN